MSETKSVGIMRRNSDMRQIAGLMLVLGMCSVIAPLANIAMLVGKDGETASSGVPLARLIGSLCLCGIGVVSVFAGYNQLIHDWGNKSFTLFMILFTQTAFIPYISDMTAIGKMASTGAAFIPEVYGPSAADVWFVGAMGIIGVLCYGFAYVGSISFMHFTIYSYQTGKPRSAPYYRGRQCIYSFILASAGLAQLMLGAKILKFRSGPLPAPIIVAMFTVNFPGISVFVGAVEVLFGLWGIVRCCGVGVFGTNDVSFQGAMFFAWFVQLMLQIIVQISYEGPVPAPAMIAAMSVGLNLMPAFLDYKARTLPREITPEYYGMDVSKLEEKLDLENQKHEAKS